MNQQFYWDVLQTQDESWHHPVMGFPVISQQLLGFRWWLLAPVMLVPGRVCHPPVGSCTIPTPLSPRGGRWWGRWRAWRGCCRSCLLLGLNFKISSFQGRKKPQVVHKEWCPVPPGFCTGTCWCFSAKRRNSEPSPSSSRAWAATSSPWRVTSPFTSTPTSCQRVLLRCTRSCECWVPFCQIQWNRLVSVLTSGELTEALQGKKKEEIWAVFTLKHHIFIYYICTGRRECTGQQEEKWNPLNKNED